MLKKTKKMTLSDQAYKYIKEKILTGELSGGDIITESGVGSVLKMSRTPVKRAFTQLEYENYLSSVDGVGTIVSSLSIKDLIDLYECRKILEVAALKTSINNIDSYELAELRKEFEKIIMDCDNNIEIDSDYATALDLRFHNMIADNTDNAYIENLLDSIDSKVQRYKFEAYYLTKTERTSATQHIKIIDLIEKKDYDKAKEALENHINWSLGTLKEAFSHNIKIKV